MPSRKADAKEVLHILRTHIGRNRAIRARSIAWEISASYGRYADRAVRATIRELRRQGHLILSTTEAPAGYFLAANAGEWQRYGQPMRGRAFDLLATVKAMDEAAGMQFGAPDGPSTQMELELA